MTATAAAGIVDYTEHATEFRQQGFTVIRGFFTRDVAAQLLAEVQRCAREDVAAAQAAGLTDNGIVYTGRIFLRSALFRQVLSSQPLVDFIKAVAGTGDLWITMDQAVTKNPNAGVFRWHQDNGYTGFKTEHFQLWIALTETRLENGALQLAPGSHNRGRLRHKYIANGQVEVQEDVGPTVRVDATAGDIILFSSLMLHATAPNVADAPRVAYVAEYMPLAHFAPGIAPPHFVVARDGRSDAQFLPRQPGAMVLRNQLMYAGPRLVNLARQTLRPLKRRLVRFIEAAK